MSGEKNIITINIDLDEVMTLLKSIAKDNNIVTAIVNSNILKQQLPKHGNP